MEDHGILTVRIFDADFKTCALVYLRKGKPKTLRPAPTTGMVLKTWIHFFHDLPKLNTFEAELPTFSTANLTAI